ncbi:YxeA family protein [Bombilactobacillus bombi]|jgi:uncharacterized protein (TIGR01655 family)|uniref:Uncharacterized protein n=1 Tax=Bombilactobacillus bombi TaxID=1303590 RepID=A0A347SR52_9LACO|nr:YxeA family protein [Bombilactobacillus bombi]AXX64511.1 YxeA family protein [Bombilactobacillus bombi]MCO6541257.1 YxeA family protein [Lactobacillus sp.]RHW45990.1 hypothetical protein DS832_06430 [Bombilactobacillus bombi]
MKKIVKSVLLIIVIIFLLLYVLSRMTINNTSTWAYLIDMLNPMVTTETVYANAPTKTIEEYRDNANNKTDYSYKVNSYNQSGQKRQIQVTSYGSKLKLDSHRYLKIRAKGQYVGDFRIVTDNQVPKKVINYLRH